MKHGKGRIWVNLSNAGIMHQLLFFLSATRPELEMRSSKDSKSYFLRNTLRKSIALQCKQTDLNSSKRHSAFTSCRHII